MIPALEKREGSEPTALAYPENVVAGAARTASTVLLVCLVAVTAVLPAAFGLAVASRWAGPLTGALGGLVLVLGVAKPAAAAWGLAARLLRRPRLDAVAVSGD